MLTNREHYSKGVKRFNKEVRHKNMLSSGVPDHEIKRRLKHAYEKDMILYDLKVYEEGLKAQGLSPEEVSAKGQQWHREKLTALFLSEGRTQQEIDEHFANVDRFMGSMTTILTLKEEVRQSDLRAAGVAA